VLVVGLDHRVVAAFGEQESEALEIAARYGVETDFEGTMPLLKRHVLSF